jgi:hypothetical protein
MTRRLALAVLLLAASARGEKPLWIAVGPKQLLAPLAPLAEHRRAQGFETALIDGMDPGARQRFPRPPDYLLLVGDDEALAPEDAPWRVAAALLPLYRWRAVQRERFASDAPWADADGDGAADRPVGRIPARTPLEVAAVVAKILAFEKRAPSPDDLRILAWAGTPSFGDALDAMASGLLVATARRYAPPWAVPWLICADASQPLCGWPPDQPDLFAREMRRGALLGAGLAHGNADGFFSMSHGSGDVWFGPTELARGFTGAAPAPPLFLLSCNCGAFDRDRPCIAERALFLAGGPVAVVGATTESHPLTNYFTGVALLKTLAEGAPQRLGDLWLGAERRGFLEKDFLVEQMLKDAEGSLEKEIDVAKLRRDQRLLYVLLGDPALRLPLPAPLDATVEKRDGAWRWTARRPEGATRLLVGLRPAQREAPAPPAGADEIALRRAQFEAANAAEGFDPVGEIGDGPWEGSVDRPGRLRLVALGPDGVAVGTLELE